MNPKTVSLLVFALILLAGFGDFYKRAKDHGATEFLREKSERLRAESFEPRHNPPIEREIIALAERGSLSFCYPGDRSADGCSFNAVLIDDEWTVFVAPYLGTPGKGYACCAPDSDRLFIYSRKGVFLRQENSGP